MTRDDIRFTLNIERAVPGGRMLARHDGRVVLVAGAIPGERVVARLESATKKVAFASVVEVVDASPDRRPPICNPACGGAVYAHIEVGRQRHLKAELLADAFRRIGRIPLDVPVPVAASAERGYRLRGRLHVQRGRVGFYLERTHRLCNAAATMQFAAETLPVVEQVVEWLGDRARACAAILVAEDVAASQRVLHLEAAEGHSLSRVPEQPPAIAGLTGLTATSGLDQMRLVWGNGRVTDTARDLCGEAAPVRPDVTWTRSAASFFQGNRFLTGTLLSKVLESRRGDRVLDLYAGVGLFAVGLAAQGARVTAVEGAQASVADLDINATQAAWDLTTRAAAVEVALLTMPAGAFDTVVLDPPRTGASAEAIAGVVALRPARVVYVSCDPATLARDAALLLSGGYTLTSVEAFDLFPNTAHVETLAVFDQ